MNKNLEELSTDFTGSGLINQGEAKAGEPYKGLLEKQVDEEEKE